MRGTLAMANAGPNTNGSQFFIMHADYALPKNYTIFGQVTKGLEVVDSIAGAARNSRDLPNEPVAMTSVSDRRRGLTRRPAARPAADRFRLGYRDFYRTVGQNPFPNHQ